MDGSRVPLVPRSVVGVVGLILGAGALARLIQFVDRRTLWYDEAMLSLNVATRTWSGLMRPLDYEQAAPVPFLWLQRAAITVLGVNEYALRLCSFLAGVAVTVLAWEVARRMLPRPQAILATALTALSPMLIRYSAEAKPYQLDALLALAVALAALALLRATDQAEARRWMYLGLVGIGAVMFSVPAVFVLGGVGLALLSHPNRKLGAWYRPTLFIGTLWLIVFVVQYLLIYQHAAANHPSILQAWEFAFLRPTAPDILERVQFALTGVMSGLLVGTVDAGRWGPIVMTGVVAQAIAAVILCVLGIVALSRRVGGWAVALVAGGVALAVIASSVGRYPVTVRLMLFAAPAILLLLASGVGAAASLFPGRIRGVVFALLSVGFLVPATARAVMTSVDPIRRQDAREVIEYLARVRAPDQPVYVYSHAIFAWGFYSTDWSDPEMDRLTWLARQAEADGPAYPGMPARSQPVRNEGSDLVYRGSAGTELIGIPTGRFPLWGRAVPESPDQGWAANEAIRMRTAGDDVWLLFVPLYAGDQEPNLSLLQAELAALGGTVIDEFHRREASLFRYRFAVE
jgi:hypothetical protein